MAKDSLLVLKEWAEHVNSKSLDDLLLLYDEDASLLPTFSNKTLSNIDGIRSYFDKLASHDQLAVNIHEKTVNVQKTSDSSEVITGIYKWELDYDGEVLAFEARFTFSICLGAERPIMHHHSSQIPRAL